MMMTKERLEKLINGYTLELDYSDWTQTEHRTEVKLDETNNLIAREIKHDKAMEWNRIEDCNSACRVLLDPHSICFVNEKQV